MNPGVSVVICTHNGADKLRETLIHLSKQETGTIPWEVVIVDNASTDNTRAHSRAVWSECQEPAPFRVVHEARPGLSFARACGFASATYEYIILCDDDNWLAPNYVRQVFEIMNDNPIVGALGGNGDLVFEEEPPEWVKKFSVFASGPQEAASGQVRKNIVYGAGCVIRRSALNLMNAAGFRSLLTDRLGKELSSGGDYEICYGLALCGFQVWYSERLTFRHFIPKERYTENYYRRYLRESSLCFDVLEAFKMACMARTSLNKLFLTQFAKLFLYYAREYAKVIVAKWRAKPGGTEHFILTLRQYSKGVKFRILFFNAFRVYKNFRKANELAARAQMVRREKIVSSLAE